MYIALRQHLWLVQVVLHTPYDSCLFESAQPTAPPRGRKNKHHADSAKETQQLSRISSGLGYVVIVELVDFVGRSKL